MTKENWEDIHKNFKKHRHRKRWEKQGFAYEEVKEWIEVVGLKISDYDFVKQWKNRNFTAEQTKEWVAVGAKLNDAKFILWLKDTKGYDLEWIQNYKEDYWTLSGRFKNYGLCPKCRQPNTGKNWCKDCNKARFQQNFQNWTSKNPYIDEFIQKSQLEATDTDKFLEWIPYEDFVDIEYLAEGGFGKVYKAKWVEGDVRYWGPSSKQWKRNKDYYYKDKQIFCHENIMNNNRRGNQGKNIKVKSTSIKVEVKKYQKYKSVVLKNLNNSSENTDFLQEISNHKIIDDWFNNIVPCYGLSQDPDGNHVMVMQYIEGGDLRKYLKNKNLTFQDKLFRLTNIAQGLKDIHQKGLIHRDFHLGNILESNFKCLITDLGLCRPVNETSQEKVYGVMPYVAPEVLNNMSSEFYTTAADIYSFGIIAYEIFANDSPYLDRDYDYLLVIDICRDGLRPDLSKVKIPQLLKDLIKRCWNADPKNRPTANELEKILRSWQNEIENKRDTEFYQQYQKVEKEYNQISQNISYKIHPTEILTSRLLDFRNLPEPHNSKEISRQFYLKESEDLDSLCVRTLNLNDSQNWTNIHPSFNQDQIQNWQKTFTYNQVQDWINVGLTPQDYQLANFLKSQKNLTPEQTLNNHNLENLKIEYEQYQQNQVQTLQVQPANPSFGNN